MCLRSYRLNKALVDEFQLGLGGGGTVLGELDRYKYNPKKSNYIQYKKIINNNNKIYIDYLSD